MKTALPNRSHFSWLLVVLACVVVVTAGQPVRRAEAQDYFRVSPGPLSAAHAESDHSAGCVNCHVSAQGVDGSKCLACHEGLKHSGGLHASFTGQACTNCHVEHKGRSHNMVNWSTIGGRDAFQHDRTGFRLENEHAQIACTKCHVRRLKSGGTSYFGLSQNCLSCHKGAHAFSNRELSKKCSTCHKSGERIRGRKLSAWASPHRRFSGVTFEGKHRDLPCTKCHEEARMTGRKPPRACGDCHAPTHPVTQPTKNCLDCHSQKAPFKNAKIDHSEFGFPLIGRHAKVSCQNCHKGGAQSRVNRGCGSCHNASHPVTRVTAHCAKCHSPKYSFAAGAKIDHEQFGLPLRGKHADISCAACHMDKRRTRQVKLKYTEGACTSCHTHGGVHQGQYADDQCVRCHVEGGKRNKPFDHNLDSRFPLIGFHAQAKLRAKCEGCHPNGIYRTGKTACRDCHEDQHQGAFGTDCTKCHTPLVRFDSPRIRDVAHSRFPLEGKHRTIPCQSCHVAGKQDLANSRCIDCHRKDDVHHGKLGESCGKCHRPTKGAPKFNHDTMTQFPLRGAHRQVRCSFCHQAHGLRHAISLAEWDAMQVPPLDLRFPSPGRGCSDCHSDPHRGRAAGACTACHTTGTFTALTGARARSVLPPSHRGAWLQRHATLPATRGSLGGDSLNCATCHGRPGCRNCHRTNAPRSHGGLWRLRMHGSAASFDAASCRVCHQTASCRQCHRRTRPLNHRGAWSTLHGYAAGGFGASNCYVCHTRADCLGCHTTP